MEQTILDGVYDVSSADYHSSAGVSRSKLMLLDKSPYHYWYEVLSGEYEKKAPTPAMKIGSLFHTLLLEPELFTNEFCIKPVLQDVPPPALLKEVGREQYELVKAGRLLVQEYNKTLMDEFAIESQGKTIISQDEFDKTYKMVSLIKRHEIVQTLLSEAKFERSIYWTDKETGIQFKARPDIWASKMIVDLKTTADASEHAFMRSSLTYGYYLQAGMMFEACKAIGEPIEMFVHLLCEKEAPHVPAVYIMKDEALQFGIDQFTKLKRQLRECLDKDEWPSYPVRELSVPKYALNQIEGDL